jgi:hypothetical protein
MKRRKALTGLSSPLLKNPHNVFGNGDRQDGKRSEHAEPPHARRLLRPRRERPCGSRTAEKGDELTPPDAKCHSTKSLNEAWGCR